MVLDRFRQHRLKLKPKKCSLFQPQVKFLGKLVSKEGVAVDPAKIAAVKSWPVPHCIKDGKSFLGFVNYHREHLRGLLKSLVACMS